MWSEQARPGLLPSEIRDENSLLVVINAIISWRKAVKNWDSPQGLGSPQSQRLALGGHKGCYAPHWPQWAAHGTADGRQLSCGQGQLTLSAWEGPSCLQAQTLRLAGSGAAELLPAEVECRDAHPFPTMPEANMRPSSQLAPASVPPSGSPSPSPEGWCSPPYELALLPLSPSHLSLSLSRLP